MTSMKFISRFMILAILFIGFGEMGCYAQKKSKKKKKGKKEVVEEVVVEKVPEVVIDTGPCSKTGPNLNDSKVAVSLYREHYKQKSYQDALPYWRTVFATAPGIQKKTFTDGEKMFKSFLDDAVEAKNMDLQKSYFDTLMMIYDKRAECWGEAGYIEGRRGLAFYKYKDDKGKSLELLQKSIDVADTEIGYSFVMPYFSMIKKKYDSKEYTLDQFSEKFDVLERIVKHNADNNDSDFAKGKFKESWGKLEPAKDGIINAQLYSQMSNCDEAKSFYQKKFDENPNDITLMKRIRSAMRRFDCSGMSNPLYKQATNKLLELDPSPGVYREIANEFLRAQDYDNAVVYYDKALAVTTDNSAKANMVYNKANIFYKKKDYPSARKFAEEAAGLRPGWGKPYLLIGTLYASSGKSCGPGTGWDSQVVVWAAMDAWGKAKNVDPDVAKKAQANINQYSKFLPVILFLVACENDLQQVNELTKEYEAAVETGKDIEMQYSEMGILRVKINGPTIKRHKTKEPFVEFPDGLIVTFYGDNGKVKSVLTADYAIRYEKEQKATLERNVVLFNDEKGEKLETEELFWNEKDQTISGNQLVTITTPRERIIGEQGFEAEQDFSTYTIKQIVDSEVIIEGDTFGKE